MSSDDHGLEDEGLADLAGEVLSRESAALAALVGSVESSVITVARQMLGVAGKVVTTGSGTSGIMAERLAHLLSVCGTPAMYLPSMDALHGGMGAITPSDLVVAISKTGQSQELTTLVDRLERRGVHVVAVTESPDSPFASAASSVAALPPTPADADPGDMIAMASTLAVGAWSDAVAVVTMSLRGHTLGDVVDGHPAGGVGRRVPGDHSAPVVRGA
ncbi:SIS domain-containing protein [Mycobacterium yunnanensis]|uniref:SIS domain-containing protein n=1 Tax=Mycobacterium yunnanensis TaxID=368477 RepID=A0A9X2YXQ2_9MYCO|nr:SIS domain-containing protein [Mycobacterium yunnanensis]MCV7420119.1 SIS domain-containing protein [Mycobacterium yunnanensis]